MTEQWFEFRAYNTEALYGFGDADEAEAFAEALNASREINVYGVHPLTETEAGELALETRSDTFRLDDELEARREG